MGETVSVSPGHVGMLLLLHVVRSFLALFLNSAHIMPDLLDECLPTVISWKQKLMPRL